MGRSERRGGGGTPSYNVLIEYKLDSGGQRKPVDWSLIFINTSNNKNHSKSSAVVVVIVIVVAVAVAVVWQLPLLLLL